MNDKIYIARDKNGTLAIYEGKPVYDEELEIFVCDDDGNGYLLNYISINLYPEVTFENSPIILKPVINNG